MDELFPSGTEKRGLKCNALENAILALQFAGKTANVAAIKKILRSAPTEKRSLKRAECRETSFCYQIMNRKVPGLKVRGLVLMR